MTAVVLIMALAVTTAGAQGNLPEPVQAAVADLAQRLQFAQDAITVASFEEVTWPDASLGNPEPGRVYAQVLTPGYRVYLQAQGQRYEYHTDMNRNVTLVGDTPAGDAQPALDPQEQELVERTALIAQAKEDLANRLGIAPDAVYLAAMEERTWPSSALGLEEPGEMYAQVRTQGYRLILEAREVLYDYHTDLSGLVKPAGLSGDDAGAPGGGGSAGVGPAVDAAIADLARRLNHPPGVIAVVSVEDTEWPSGSLGLPEPGMMYTMAIVSGQRIILESMGRDFEYRSGPGPQVRYAGIVFDPEAEVGLLAMSQTEPIDGNNFFRLLRIDPVTQERQIVLESISSFAATPDGRDLIVKRRTSRSTHLLAHVADDGVVTEVAAAFDFHAMAIRPDGTMVAYWARPSLGGQAPELIVSRPPWDEEMQMRLQLPGTLQSTGSLLWTDDGLAITAQTDGGPRSYYWTAEEGLRELGTFEVLGWIPRTRALLIQRPEGERAVLAAFIPGMGETAVLTDADTIQSAAAPVGEQWVLATVREGPETVLQRIAWGGMAETLDVIEGAEFARVAVSPVGQIAVTEYTVGGEVRADIFDLAGDLDTIQTIGDAVGATPVAF